MHLTFKTSERKQYEMVQKNGKWHKKFVIWPREVLCENGIRKVVFLSMVYRKATFRFMHTDVPKLYPVYKYREKDNAVLDALQEDSEFEFDCRNAESHYNRIKRTINE